MRSRPCCQQGQGPASVITIEVEATAAIRGKNPAVDTKVKVSVAAETKVEKTKSKEVVATVVAGE